MTELIYMRTHYIDRALISEYKKLYNSVKNNYNCILFADNHNNFLKLKNYDAVKSISIDEINTQCVIYDEKLHEKLKLPYFTQEPDNRDLGKIMWYNSDYPFYIVRKLFPNYDFYWSIEPDVFCNGKSYKPFFNRFENDNSDLLSTYYKKVTNEDNWYWDNNYEWCYGENTDIYKSFFPVIRLSGKAIDFLYTKRLEHAELFEKYKLNYNNRWLFCELFVPTELANNGFKCTNIIEPNIRYLPVWNLNKERIFEQPDDKLYHPVK